MSNRRMNLSHACVEHARLTSLKNILLSLAQELLPLFADAPHNAHHFWWREVGQHFQCWTHFIQEKTLTLERNYGPLLMLWLSLLSVAFRLGSLSSHISVCLCHSLIVDIWVLLRGCDNDIVICHCIIGTLRLFKERWVKGSRFSTFHI